MIPKPFSALAIATALAITPLMADEIKLKSGETFSGRITYEADDIVKIEVAINASIKETKIIARGDIESIVKDAPDDVAFNKLQGLVPTGSMVSVDNYRRMLETGPDAFLRDFPDSKHVPKVKELRATLAEELDKVERGFVKIESDWYSPQDKVAFKELIDSRARLVRMEGFARGNNLASYIAAMREYEFIEENYLGSPAFPRAVELARQVVPNLGRQLQTLAKNVDYQNEEYQRALASSTPDAQTKLVAAREREDKVISDSVAADKKAGVKWVQLNPRSKPAIEEYLKLASAENTRLGEYNTAALAAQAEQLVEVDRLIAEDKIDDAKAKLAAATAQTGQAADAKSKSKSKSSSKSKGKGPAKAGSYIAVLSGKIDAKVQQVQEEEKAKKAAAASQALTANLKQPESGEEPKPADPSAEGEETEADESAEEDTAEEAPKEAEVDGFAALASSKKAPAKEDAKKKGDSKKTSSKKSKTKAKEEAAEDEEEDAAPRRPAPVVEEEGGFPFWLIGVIVSALAAVAVVVMKVLGVGKKGDD